MTVAWSELQPKWLRCETISFIDANEAFVSVFQPKKVFFSDLGDVFITREGIKASEL